MDGIWTLTVAMTLPLAKPAAKLAPTRPTASILGLHTLSSTLGVLFINLIYTVIALFLLWGQDFFQCRKWEFNDVSNVSCESPPSTWSRPDTHLLVIPALSFSRFL